LFLDFLLIPLSNSTFDLTNFEALFLPFILQKFARAKNIFTIRISLLTALVVQIASSISTSGEICKRMGSKPKTTESKMSPTALLTTIEKIEKLIDEIPEEFILDVQTALNKVFAHRLSAGSVICCHATIADNFDIVITLQRLNVERNHQEAESETLDEVAAIDQQSKPPTKKRRTKVSFLVTCKSQRV
jgi:hypothetical protein